MSFLELTDLRKTYGDVVALENFNLTVEKGEFISLLGPSGCGKTTTLQMIAGFTEPTAGKIVLSGRDLVSVPPAKRGLGIVFQSYALFPHLSAAENVAFGLDMRKVDRASRDERVREALAMVGLKGYEDRFPRRMSGGQQQRVAVARALVIRPEILLLDEPLSNLDAKMREEMQGELLSIQRRLGTTTILVTHDQQEAMALSNRVVVMSKGRIEQIASPVEAYNHPASPFVASFLGKTNTLSGEVRGGTLSVGDYRADVPGADGPVAVTLRPEKMRFDATGLRGTVASRVFQGNSWSYHVDTAQGEVLVLRQNDGQPLPVEGEPVFVSWSPADMGVHREGARHG
ncbi:ABC transporter ATP-binding protein [Paracoccus sp. Z118]|uniref:ABC transporter ATP-binding protein n=1 Tax=Paracoccus sp. Z118 TaxID=2851017 RepID=UPI001C2C60C2|nr:ABC transporter ATP-binding protein [Paracoccus sp. Z118]MBV0890957.1 ABC transporter ATP-binding protein [Paracoccus sp. Z118]